MIFLFLRSGKAAVVVGLAIPLSLTAALVALYLTGNTVNIMTLGGLALVIGTLLDNNIVVQENLHRHLEMGKDGRSAAEDSATELTLPILVATICILIVYLPIMFFSGIIKYLFVPLALTVAELSRSLSYYTEAIGLTVLDQSPTAATLGVAGEPLLELSEQPGAADDGLANERDNRNAHPIGVEAGRVAIAVQSIQADIDLLIVLQIIMARLPPDKQDSLSGNAFALKNVGHPAT